MSPIDKQKQVVLRIPHTDACDLLTKIQCFGDPGDEARAELYERLWEAVHGIPKTQTA